MTGGETIVLQEPDEEDTILVIHSQSKHIVVVQTYHLLDNHGCREVLTDPLGGELEMTLPTYPLPAQDWETQTSRLPGKEQTVIQINHLQGNVRIVIQISHHQENKIDLKEQVQEVTVQNKEGKMNLKN